MNRLCVLCALCLAWTSFAIAAETIFPLKISENRRYFVTQQNRPFLYHADTGWQIFTRLTREEALEYLAFRKSQGFNTVQVQIAMDPALTNRFGHKAFDGDMDFARPNEPYHEHIRSIIEEAERMGLLVVMSQPWLGCCEEGFGGRPDKPIRKNGPAKNRQYGQYLGRKFAAAKNLFWIMGGDNDPKGDRESLFGLFEGLYEAAPRHQLMTYHASPPHSSTDLFQYAPWLGFSFIYTYWREKPNTWTVADLQPHVYEAALREWSKSDVMPFVLGESQYEGTGVKDNDMGTPHIIRRQAYWTMLCGGAGHSYGSDIWEFPPNWREIMKYPGAEQMGHFIRFFEQLPWWTLQPDSRHEVLVAGYGDWSENNFVTAAVSDDKKLLVAYLPELQPVTVNLGQMSGEAFEARWFDPRTGQWLKTSSITEKKVTRLQPPRAEDVVLVLRAK